MLKSFSPLSPIQNTLPPFKALVLAILTHPHTFTMIAPSTVHLSFLYPRHCSPWEELFIIAAHLWFISPGMDANSSLRACFKELRMSAAGPNLCSQTTRSVCRDAPFVFRAKQSSQRGASSSHLNSDSVSWFFFFFTRFTALSLSLSLSRTCCLPLSHSVILPKMNRSTGDTFCVSFPAEEVMSPQYEVRGASVAQRLSWRMKMNL